MLHFLTIFGDFGPWLLQRTDLEPFTQRVGIPAVADGQQGPVSFWIFLRHYEEGLKYSLHHWGGGGCSVGTGCQSSLRRSSMSAPRWHAPRELLWALEGAPAMVCILSRSYGFPSKLSPQCVATSPSMHLSNPLISVYFHSTCQLTASGGGLGNKSLTFTLWLSTHPSPPAAGCPCGGTGTPTAARRCRCRCRPPALVGKCLQGVFAPTPLHQIRWRLQGGSELMHRQMTTQFLSSFSVFHVYNSVRNLTT